MLWSVGAVTGASAAGYGADGWPTDKPGTVQTACAWGCRWWC